MVSAPILTTPPSSLGPLVAPLIARRQTEGLGSGTSGQDSSPEDAWLIHISRSRAKAMAGMRPRWSKVIHMAIKAGAPEQSLWLTGIGVGAALFGVLMVTAGGRVLSGQEGPRLAAGAYVPFVLWFNFSSGFAYVLIGIGLIFRDRRAAQGAVLLTVAILVVFAAFGFHIAQGGAFEARTVGAMAIRAFVWLTISIAACRSLGCRSTRQSGTGSTP